MANMSQNQWLVDQYMLQSYKQFYFKYAKIQICDKFLNQHMTITNLKDLNLLSQNQIKFFFTQIGFINIDLEFEASKLWRWTYDF